MRRVVAVLILFLVLQHGARAADLQAVCAASGNDDTLRPYEPALRDAALRAFRTLFPASRRAPPDAMLRAQAVFRCKGGRVYACFRGANLPCGKLPTTTLNSGADSFCRENPGAASVPMVATGHDTQYSYRCRGSRATVAATNFHPDARGFARELWAPADGE
jgi:hypothetical protein